MTRDQLVFVLREYVGVEVKDEWPVTKLMTILTRHAYRVEEN